MLRKSWRTWLTGFFAVVMIASLLPVAAANAEDSSRAAWLMGRVQLEDLALTGQRFEQSEIGGSGGDQTVEVPGLQKSKGGMSGAWPVLMSLVLPGAGEVAIGYKRGYVMAAADIFAWTQVAKYHSDGEDMREAYYAYADEHYSDERLVWAHYGVQHPDDREGNLTGQGEEYFPDIGIIWDVEDLGDGEGNDLPLYVTKESDLREYYENLGKWDQFIFGWDDYQRPDQYPGYTATGDRNPDLLQPWVSVHREEYRAMREESNDAYKTRDRWLYMNIGLRVFSVLQVAYLQGLLGGGPSNKLEVAGHPVELIAQPYGLTRGVMAAKVAF